MKSLILTGAAIAVLQLFTFCSGQAPPSSYGTLFAGVLPPSRKSNTPSSDCRFYINTVNRTTVTIQSRNSLTSEDVPAQQTFIYTNEGCSLRVDPDNDDDGKENKTYRITANNPVSVLVISEFGDDDMDATLLYPLTMDEDTYEYYMFTFQKEDETDDTFGSCGNLTDVASFFTIAAAEDNTSIRIEVAPDYDQANEVTLNRFETYSEVKQVSDRKQGYTGNYVTSNQPITVISGTLCADATVTTVEAEGVAWSAVPPLSEWAAGDHLSYEQFTYGTFGVEQRDFYRVVVLASEDDTLVTIAGIDNTINRGATVQYQFEEDFEKITCDKPCLVTQVSENRQSATGSTGIFQIQVSPVANYGTVTAFTNYRVGFLTLYFLRIVTTNDQDFRDIVVTGDIEEREPWECKDLLAGGRACTWLGQIQDDQVQGVIQSFNPNANFSAVVYWSSAANDGRGYGFNAGTYFPM